MKWENGGVGDSDGEHSFHRCMLIVDDCGVICVCFMCVMACDSQSHANG